MCLSKLSLSWWSIQRSGERGRADTGNCRDQEGTDPLCFYSLCSPGPTLHPVALTFFLSQCLCGGTVFAVGARLCSVNSCHFRVTITGHSSKLWWLGFLGEETRPWDPCEIEHKSCLPLRQPLSILGLSPVGNLGTKLSTTLVQSCSQPHLCCNNSSI